MSSDRYRVVLTGELMEGYDAERAIHSLAALFKQPPEKLRHVFNGKPLPLNKEIDSEQARQIQARFHSFGAKCIVEPVGRKPMSLSLVEDAAPAEPAKASPAPGASAGAKGRVTCPKCGNVQDEPTECRRCGVVFAKWRAAAPSQEEAPRSRELSEDQLLHAFTGNNADKYLDRFRHFRPTNGFAVTWHWPAFFVAPLWAFYRKLWVWGIVMMGLNFVPMVWYITPFVWGLTANYIYFRHARAQVEKLGRTAEAADATAAGGTSVGAVFLAMGLHMAIALALVMPMMQKAADAQEEYVAAAEDTMQQGENTPEGRKTTMMVQATAMITNLWLATGKDVREASLERVAEDLQQPVEKFKDGWGNLLRVTPTAASFEVRSSGPDGEFGTGDDITFEAPARPQP